MLLPGSLKAEVVVEAGETQLLQAPPQLHWSPEVKGRALHWGDFSWGPDSKTGVSA